MSTAALRRRSMVALVLVAGALALGACGDDDDEGAATGAATGASTQTDAGASTQPAPAAQGGGSELEVTAVEDGGLSFDPAELSADAGPVTITMDNPDGNTMPHTVEVEGNGVEQAGDVVQAGETATVSVDLQPGTYTYYCPVGQHRQAGMEGTLTVK